MTTHFYNTADDSETSIAIGNNHISPEDRAIAIRTGNSVVSYQGGEVRDAGGYASVNTADIESSGGLQARTPWGSPRQGNLQPTDILNLPNWGETSVQVAERLGLIERSAHGQYVLVPDGAARALANEQPEEAPQEAGEALPNAAVEADLGDLCASITPTTQVAMVQQIIANGEINPNTLARAAGEGSIEPGALSERLSAVIGSFTAQADSTLKGFGADDTSLFYDWVRENDPAGLRKAMNDHVMSRSTKGYEPLFRSYVETLADHAPDDVLNAQFGDGITARKINNQVILEIPERGQMSFRAAVKAGFIKVSGI